MTFKVGDRVKVKGSPHMRGQNVGTVALVSKETPYAVKFDGMDGVHKWYVDSEIEAADDVGSAMDDMRGCLDALARLRRALDK